MTFKYVPNSEAKKTPRVVPIKVGRNTILVGVGGDVKRAAKPPRRAAVEIKEATSEQYKMLCEAGMTNLIDKVAVKKAKAKSSQDTGENKSK